MTDMTSKICGVDFKNPVIGASGTFGFGREFEDYFDIGKLGGISTKGLTINKKDGNSGIRIHETPSGIMNSIGLQNPGVKAFIEDELPNLKTKNTVIIANLGGATIEDYLKGLELLNQVDIDMVELNISCPNVKEGGMAFGIKCDSAREIVKLSKQVCKKPMIVKLSPNAENIREMAYTCVDSGADGISLVNTFNALAIDIKNRRPVFDNITAGLSGPAIKPIALRMVYEVCKTVDVPVIGMGGIVTASDAIEYIMAGASAIQVGTGNFLRPDLILDVVNGIEEFMISENIKTLNEIKGII